MAPLGKVIGGMTIILGVATFALPTAVRIRANWTHRRSYLLKSDEGEG